MIDKKTIGELNVDDVATETWADVRDEALALARRAGEWTLFLLIYVLGAAFLLGLIPFIFFALLSPLFLLSFFVNLIAIGTFDAVWPTIWPIAYVVGYVILVIVLLVLGDALDRIR